VSGMINWYEFERLIPHLEAALSYNDSGHTLDDVKDGLISGEYQLWPGRDSVIVTEYTETPHEKILNYFLAGGNLDELKSMVPAVEAYAKLRGASKVVLYGRKGWQRTFLKDMNYDPKWVVMVKEL
jgi:hypothetical protein